jgi:hypothetical protein
MKKVRWFHAFGLAAVTLMLSVALGAQGDPKDLLLKKLNEQFVPTKFTADKGNIVTAGVVVVLKEDGLLIYPAWLPMAPISVPKKGKLTQGFGDTLLADMTDGPKVEGGASAIPKRTLVAGEKIWVSLIDVGKDSIKVNVVTDPYDDGRYFGTIKFLIPKGIVLTPEDGVKMISEVLDVEPAQDQGTQQAAFSGQYSNTNPRSTEHFLFLPDGTFTKFVGDGQGQGHFTVNDDTLTLTSSKTGASYQLKIQGDKLINPNTRQEFIRTGDVPVPGTASAPASTADTTPAPAPMQAIAPPPPPTDAPPPTLEIGQTMDQVTASFGQPLKVAKVGAKTFFYYKDMKVTFTNGKVSNVE